MAQYTASTFIVDWNKPFPNGTRFVMGRMKLSGTISFASDKGILVDVRNIGLQDVQQFVVTNYQWTSSGDMNGTMVAQDNPTYSTTGSIKTHVQINMFNSSVGGYAPGVVANTKMPACSFFAIGNPRNPS